MNHSKIKEYLDSVGEISSMSRLKAIASLGLGERSKAARRVIYKRLRRLELMHAGATPEIARLIVNMEELQASES